MAPTLCLGLRRVMVLYAAMCLTGSGMPVFLADPTPSVHHSKAPGRGYMHGSPLYRKQESMRDNGLAVPPPAASGLEVPRVSTTFACVTYLVALFVAVHTGYFIVGMLKEHQLAGANEKSHAEGYVLTLFFAPMACVLFLAGYLRAQYLCQGNPESCGLPAWWVEMAMIVATVAMFLQSFLAVMYSISTNQDWVNATQRSSQASGGASIGELVLTTLRYLITFCIYASFVVVCFGIVSMEAPKSIWDKGPPLSPPVWCTVFLAVLFFTVYVALAFARLVKEVRMRISREERHRFDTTWDAVEQAISFVPMLCVLFIAARLRSLQLDPAEGKLQSWAPFFFHVATTMVVLQVVVALAAIAMGVNIFDSGRQKLGGIAKAMRLARELAMWILYFCIFAVILSVVMLGQSRSKSPNMPPALRCIMFLTCLYFLVYLAQLFVRFLESQQSQLSFARDDACEAKDDVGVWWPATVKVSNPDGSYSLEIAPFGLVWAQAHIENMRPSTGLHGLAAQVPPVPPFDGRKPGQAAREGFLPRLQKFLVFEAKDAVDFSPILSVLFLAAFLRSLQLSGGRGGPPAWVRVAMYVASASVFLVILARLDYLAARVNSTVKRLCLNLQCLLMLIICSCVVAILVAIFAMDAGNTTK